MCERYFTMQVPGGSRRLVSTTPEPQGLQRKKVWAQRIVRDRTDMSSVHLKSSSEGTEEHMIKKQPLEDGIVERCRWCGSTVDTCASPDSLQAEPTN
jgi:hypothetical protein